MGVTATNGVIASEDTLVPCGNASFGWSAEELGVNFLRRR